MNPKAYRLPTQVLPRQYNIDLDARLGVLTFTGRVSIQLDVTRPTETIELHARGLRIERATIVRDGHAVSASVVLDADRELVIIHLSEQLAVGQATLEVPFEATISD